PPSHLFPYTTLFRSRLDCVSHMTEAAALPAGTENGDRLSLERLSDEGRQDHPVATRLPRTHGVKQAADHYRQSLFFPVGKSEELIQGLGRGVGPAGLRSRAQHDIVIFPKRDFGVLSVHFRGGG